MSTDHSEYRILIDITYVIRLKEPLLLRHSCFCSNFFEITHRTDHITEFFNLPVTSKPLEFSELLTIYAADQIIKCGIFHHCLSNGHDYMTQGLQTEPNSLSPLVLFLQQKHVRNFIAIQKPSEESSFSHSYSLSYLLTAATNWF